jgi:thioredoxin reductase
MNLETYPVVIIGAGPVGLAAAAHVLDRGLTPLVLEAGAQVGAGMARWSHVRMFSPWRYAIDARARVLLERHGWTAPDETTLPTGGDVVARYLQPLARTPEIAPHLRLNARVTRVSKRHRDVMKNPGRDETPFLVRYEDANGEHDLLARAVIDASGTIDTPNPLGASGLPAIGEQSLREHIAYGLPDVLGVQRARYAGKRVLVVGSGHSAFNVLQDLARLVDEAPGTTIHWAIRRDSWRRVLGGGDKDQLVERGRLGQRIGRLVEAGRLSVSTRFELERLRATPEGIVALSSDRELPAVDEIVACTGFRPHLDLLAELRLALDPGTQSPVALAPLIDPNLHSCGSVRPHGAEQLKHPDANVYIVGMKSYGRAPTFLLLTGYEQVRSVVAAIAGDWEAARRDELQLPETGVCITDFSEPDTEASAIAGSSCCGGPPKADTTACCVRDEDAKAAGATGCGCGPRGQAVVPAKKTQACC